MDRFWKVVDKIQENRWNTPMWCYIAMRDSSIVVGTLTDEDGKFRMEKVKYGRMYAIANFMGYFQTKHQ